MLKFRKRVFYSAAQVLATKPQGFLQSFCLQILVEQGGSNRPELDINFCPKISQSCYYISNNTKEIKGSATIFRFCVSVGLDQVPPCAASKKRFFSHVRFRSRWLVLFSFFLSCGYDQNRLEWCETSRSTANVRVKMIRIEQNEQN